jgi:biopolymer transport protein ExbD
MARKEYDNPKAEMTPMIDVVFQLMIFFIVTIKQEDIFSRLASNRPASAASSSEKQENTNQITIDVGEEVVVFNRGERPDHVVAIERSGEHKGEVVHRGVDKETGKEYRTLVGTGIDHAIAKLAKNSKDMIVVVNCAERAPHGALVQVLDVCNYNGLENVSVFSLGKKAK